MNRIKDFHRIVDSVTNKQNYYLTDDLLLINEDSLKVLSLIPSHSVGLILTDPPYHSTKKGNITNDKSFQTDNDYLAWMSLFFKEWKRILRPNGSLFLFCSSTMEAKLQNKLESEFNILSNIVWTKPNAPGFDGWKQKMKKEALRQWYPQSERIIFAEPAYEGNMNRSYFANFLRKSRKEVGISAHYLAEQIGAFGKINHGGAVSNWETGRNIPSREQYNKIKTVFLEKGLTKLPDYEDIIRPFMVNSNVEFTDIWTFPSVHPHKGKHPAEKPVEMLKHAILATTFEGDIVLDCFAGSGNTGIAANELNRKAILIEIEEKWYKEIKDRFLADGLFPLSLSNKGKHL
jgi:site-specific DNA-methyltransferase (adenine-specific)